MRQLLSDLTRKLAGYLSNGTGPSNSQPAPEQPSELDKPCSAEQVPPEPIGRGEAAEVPEEFGWRHVNEYGQRAIFFAQTYAERLLVPAVSPEHILLGLVQAKDTAAAQVLMRMGVSMSRIRADVERLAVRGSAPSAHETKLSEAGKRVVDFAFDSARNLKNDYIGTEHLLLGVIRETRGIAGHVLSQYGVTYEQAFNEVWTMQHSAETVSTPPAMSRPSDLNSKAKLQKPGQESGT